MFKLLWIYINRSYFIDALLRIETQLRPIDPPLDPPVGEHGPRVKEWWETRQTLGQSLEPVRIIVDTDTSDMHYYWLKIFKRAKLLSKEYLSTLRIRQLRMLGIAMGIDRDKLQKRYKGERIKRDIPKNEMIDIIFDFQNDDKYILMGELGAYPKIVREHLQAALNSLHSPTDLEWIHNPNQELLDQIYRELGGTDQYTSPDPAPIQGTIYIDPDSYNSENNTYDFQYTEDLNARDLAQQAQQQGNNPNGIQYFNPANYGIVVNQDNIVLTPDAIHQLLNRPGLIVNEAFRSYLTSLLDQDREHVIPITRN